VAHMAQALERLQNEARKTEAMPSNVTFITGPSNTADIELVRVVGVHGPVNAAVMLVEG
ncbi:MAG: LUD domain-containing protein, partial [Slackia piriformis]|nr:LUD domain-containing protein [Slackia piriformis]